MLNDTLALDSADEYRLTGTDTRPNEMVAVAMERAGMDRPGNGLSAEMRERRTGELRLTGEHQL
jgi:hypothetical protein